MYNQYNSNHCNIAIKLNFAFITHNYTVCVYIYKFLQGFYYNVKLFSKLLNKKYSEENY